MNSKYYINKLALTIFAILAITHMYAQDKDGIYVVIEAKNNMNLSEKTENAVRSTYISEDYKEPAQIFASRSRCQNRFYFPKRFPSLEQGVRVRKM